jgi:hypothetical protein
MSSIANEDRFRKKTWSSSYLLDVTDSQPLFMVGCFYFIHHRARAYDLRVRSNPLFTQTDLQRIGVKQNTNKGRKQLCVATSIDERPQTICKYIASIL